MNEILEFYLLIRSRTGGLMEAQYKEYTATRNCAVPVPLF